MQPDWNAILHQAAQSAMHFLISLAIALTPMLTDRAVTMDWRSWALAVCLAVGGASGVAAASFVNLKKE